MFYRQFARATPLLLDSLSTFTATELLPYEKLVLYSVVAGTLTLSRVETKKKVYSAIYTPGVILNVLIQILQSPEVNSVLHEIKDLPDYCKSLYDCHYDKFYVALGKLVSPSVVKCPHADSVQLRWNRLIYYLRIFSAHIPDGMFVKYGSRPMPNC